MQRVNIAIASPSDVKAERDAVLRIFTRWNDTNEHAFLHPLMWESASVPTLGDHPQHILNKALIDRSDLLVAILWSRLGTPTPTAPSGTVEEIREFIRFKGATRVMLYFCRRDLPYDIDPADIVELRKFKAQMQSQGLYCEYATVGEFERDLYQHLDVKVRNLLGGQLPVPIAKAATVGADTPTRAEHPDPRLRELLDFGTTLDSISKGFSARMGEFDKVGGAGRDKYLDLGAHVFSSCAMCLDRFLAYSASGMAEQDRVVLERTSSRLKRLAANRSEYHTKPFPQFWADGQEICNDLAAHADYLRRLLRAKGGNS